GLSGSSCSSSSSSSCSSTLRPSSPSSLDALSVGQPRLKRGPSSLTRSVALSFCSLCLGNRCPSDT
ncbi:hypothetical protein PENTCL1PPCAC_8367, partial [Pristionchus entomophagus]